MIRVTTFAGRRVAVFGLARSGIASAQALMAGGAEVVCWDDAIAGREAAAKAGLPVADLGRADWSRLAALVLAPGVPLTHPKPHWTVEAARVSGVPIIGDIELFLRQRAAEAPGSPVIAITGTNGKSTTTALIAHLLAAGGHDAAMGGNIGVGVLSLAPPAQQRIHVLELSSFQIDLTPGLDPSVGVLLNVSPDHLDRHGALADYARIKARLAEGAAAACIGTDDAITRAVAEHLIATRGGATVYPFSAGRDSTPPPRFYADRTAVVSREPEGGGFVAREIANLAGIDTLRGAHNMQNALAAVAALRALQEHLSARDGGAALRVFDAAHLQRNLASFPGLAHRLEEIGRAGPVLIINDSKATNADSTEKALASFPGNIHWIVGGTAKEGGIAPLEPYFPRIAKAYLIGASSDAFAATLGAKVAFERCGTLANATVAAVADARRSSAAEPVVLLSPACASYDQFKSFEHRGDAFRHLVAEQPDIALTKRGGAPTP